MTKYLSFFRIRFINGLQYRLAACGGIATQFAWGFMLILMYDAFYKADSSAFPMEFPRLSAYIWLQQAFLALFATWSLDNEIFSLITSGNIAYELSRPTDLYNMWFVKNLAMRLSRAVLRCMPILVVAALLPAPYGISLPADISCFLGFIAAVVLGFFTVVAFCMLLYITTFYTLSPLGVRIAALSVTELLSGALIPLPFFPENIRRIAELTPFAAMQNLPFRIYGGDISGRNILYGILLQLFWLSFLVIFGRIWMAKALKKIVVQGG